MNLVRSLLVLVTSIVASGLVQAESASLYTKIRKSLPARFQQSIATPRPVIQPAFPPIAQLNVTPKAQTVAPSTSGSATPLTGQSAMAAAPASALTPAPTLASAPEMQPIETILPAGSRIVAGDETKNEFYILEENQPDPPKPSLSEAVVERQLQRMDTPRLLWALNELPHVDVILSQIAHNVVGSESDTQQSPAVTSAAMPLPKAEKNGDVADIQVALDKTFEETSKQVVKPVDQSEKTSSRQNKVIQEVPATVVKPQSSLAKHPIVAFAKSQHPSVSHNQSIKVKTVVNAKLQPNLMKEKVAVRARQQHPVVKAKVVVDSKPQHQMVKVKVAANDKLQHQVVKMKVAADVKSPHQVVKTKVAVDGKPQHQVVKTKLVANGKPQHQVVKTKLVVNGKLQHQMVKTKIAADVKPQRQVVKTKVVVNGKPQRQVVKVRAVADGKPQHQVIKTKVIVDAKPQAKPIKKKSVTASTSQTHHFWGVEKSKQNNYPARVAAKEKQPVDTNRKRMSTVASRHASTHANS